MPNTLRATVDQLGDIRAAIKKLQEKEVALKAEIAERGVGDYEGDAYLAQVVQHETRKLDIDAARAKLVDLGVKPQWFSAHTTVTQVTRVNCKAKAPDIAVGFEADQINVSWR